MSRSLFAAALLFASIHADASAVRHHFEAATARGGVRRVVVDIPAGDIEVRNGPGDRIAVSGWVGRDRDLSRDDGKEQRVADDISVEIAVDRDEATVRRTFGPNAHGWRVTMFTDYHVTVDVPRGIDVDILTKYGDVRVDGSFGDLDINLRAGDIDISMPKREVRQLNASVSIGDMRARFGDEIVEREGVFHNETRYENPNGRSLVNVHATAGDMHITLTK